MPSALSPHRPVCCFSRDDRWRGRSVGPRVPTGRIDLPALPARLLADLARETAALALEPGDVEQLSLARARSRWPDFRLCVAAAGDWLQAQGLPAALLADAERSLMACRGARFHHDGERYGGAAFFNVFVGGAAGLELHFAATGQRLALERGTAVVFDTCQPHAVLPCGSAGFDARDFLPERDWTQYFLTWELPIDDTALAAALGVGFDVDPDCALRRSAGVSVGGRAAEVCPVSGRWRPAAS